MAKQKKQDEPEPVSEDKLEEKLAEVTESIAADRNEIASNDRYKQGAIAMRDRIADWLATTRDVELAKVIRALEP